MKRILLNCAGFTSLMLVLMLDSIFAQGVKNKIDPALSALYSQLSMPSQPQKISQSVAKPSGPFEIFCYKPVLGKVFSVDMQSPDPEVRVIMKYHGQINELEALGIDVQSKIGDLVTAHFPISRLQLLAQRKDVGYIELGKPVELHLDVSAGKVRAPEARSTFGRTGANVIIGIVDAGMDITHQDFIKPDGTTRILYIWDQTLTPIAGESSPSGYSYGVEYTQAQINNEIDGTPAGFVRTKDLGGHGTHVTGIAAGNGRATGNNVPAGTYVGMAPEADLIFVRAKFGVGSNTADVIDGLLWIGTKAAQLAKPWVANLSLGNRWGPKDGTSNFEQAVFGVTNQTDLGKGRIIVNSAGNDGHDLSDPNKQDGDRYHAGGQSTSNRILVVNSNDNPALNSQSEIVWIEIWYPWNNNYSVTVTSPLGGSNHVYGPYGKGQGTGDPGYGHYIDEETTTDGLVVIHNEHFDTSWNPKNDFYTTTLDNLIIIALQDLNLDGDADSERDLRAGNWTLSLSNASGRWDAYIPHAATVNGVWFDQSSYENARIITEPGNAFNVITVGSFNSKNSWTDVNNNPQTQNGYPIDFVSYFSSPGPTRDGRPKPDIYAPGAWIASSLSDDATITSNPYKARDGKHYHGAGTSAAAPHVTGAVALLLQQNNNYTFGDIISILDQSKTFEGYLDIYAALDVNEDPTGIEDGIGIMSGPNIVNQNSNATYGATFFDEPPTGDYIVGGWTWQLYAYHDQGNSVLASGTTGGSYSTSWTAYIGALPTNNNWVRDENGRVAGKVFVQAKDTDNIWHEAEKSIAINAGPATPVVYRKEAGNGQVKLSFIGSGASTYKVFYDVNSGVPYTGSGATQGPSPIDVGANNTLTLTGLTNGTTYYFAIKGYNSNGESNYSSEYIATPITISGTLTQNETWPGTGNSDTVFVTGSVTVPSSKTLTINPSTVVKFTSGTNLIINGTLNANGASASRITFTRNGASGTWGGIIINSGSSSNVSTLKRCDVTYATTGIKITYTGNTNDVTIHKCRISNNSSRGIHVNGNGKSGATAYIPVIRENHIHDNGSTGIYLQSYAKPRIAANRIENNSSYGIYGTGSCSASVDSNYVSANVPFGMALLSNSHAEINRNTVQNNIGSGGGIWASSSSNLIGYNGPNDKGRNRIMTNSGDGIYSQNSSPDFGNSTSAGGYNQIQDNTGYQARASGSGLLKAEVCYWAGQEADITGNVDNVPILVTTPSPVGWGQSSGYDPSTRVHSPEEFIEDVEVPILASMRGEPLNDEIDADTFDPKLWSAKFDSSMKAGLENGDWGWAARYITELWRELQDARVPEVDYAPLTGYAEQPEVDSAIRKYLALTLVEKKLAVQDISAALDDLAKYRKSNPEHDAELLANAGIINLHFKNDLAAAENILSQLRTRAAQNEVAAAEQERILAELIDNYRQRDDGASPPEGRQSAQTQIATEASLELENFPNPFNPETLIRYRVSGEGAHEVSLVIYNTLGQRVRTLVAERKNPGDYSIQWNGQDNFGAQAASGMYFLRAMIGEKALTRKLMLLR